MIVIKIGGVVATDLILLERLLSDIKAQANSSMVLVHGGGKEVTSFGERLGLKAEFRDGIRLTTPQEMEVVDMVLGGKINIDLVRRARAAGLNSIGLGGQDGGLFVGEARVYEDRTQTRTGQIVQTDSTLLRVLTEAGYFPIVNSTSMDQAGQGLNINADEAAQALAIQARATVLLFVSDIAGVLKEGKVMTRLNKAAIEAEIATGVIAGGMVPKVRSALQAVASGVGSVVIGGYQNQGDLARLLTGLSGTTIE